ncbi:MAG TPA: hypothetical protein VHB21_20950 [Minicystis sp.]|nr:hypothetical protein [Minicystis sp.]
MEPKSIIAIVALLSVFGAPVAIVYVIRLFRLKERELQLEAGGGDEARTRALEARLERIERLLVTIERDVRALPGAPAAPQLPPAAADVEPTRATARGR